MGLEALPPLIRDKLQGGRLPYESIARVWSSPSDGETRDACETRIAKDQSVTEVTLAGDSRGGGATSFPLGCFQFLGGVRPALYVPWPARDKPATRPPVSPPP